MEGLINLHNSFHNIGWLNNMVKFITHLGDVGCFWLMLAFVLFWFKKTRNCSIMIVVSLLIGYVFNNLVLKNIFNRARPFEENSVFKDFLLEIKMELPDGSSFPSGHAFSSFCCATIVFLFHKKLGILSFVVAILIALSRVYLCVHYPTDVLAGAVIGALFAIMMFYIYRLVMRKIDFIKREKVRKNDVQS